jgi:hypothetical protein
MLRDVVMIFSVLVSVVSVGFGFFKNIEAGNNRAFIYETAYGIIGNIQEADISQQAKAELIDDALRNLGTPPPVLDLSRSSADVGDDVGACTFEQKQKCTALADTLGIENAACAKSNQPTGPLCGQASQTRARITSQACYSCF